MAIDGVRWYLTNGFEQVDGWCSARFVEILGHLAEEMKAAGVVGGACEIGAYQGKFMIALAYAVEGRASLAIDIFDNQQENIDNSGGGRPNLLSQFRENVAKFKHISIADLTANSFTLSSKNRIEILNHFGSFQLFSIDGGHLAEHVINDYKFAEDVTHYGGAIIISDIQNSGWPGVMEGVGHIFTSLKPKFVPLVLGHNKLVLVGVSFHDRYLLALQARIREHMPDQSFWIKKFFGYDLICLL
jgi:hypothetical protein